MSSPKVQEKTAEEKALIALQKEAAELELAKSKEAAKKLGFLEPFYLEEAGLVPQYDTAGNLTGYTKRPLTEQEQMQQDILTAQLTREKQALAGELPLNPALTRDLEQQGLDFQEQMRRQGLKAGDTGYQMAQAKFNESKEAILDSARRGDISMYEAMSLARQQDTDRRTQMLLSQYSMIPASIQNAGATFGQAVQAIAAPLNYYQNERALQLQAATSGNWASRWFQPIAGSLGALAQGGSSLFSGAGRATVSNPKYLGYGSGIGWG